jgi:hypothetical protein
MATVSVRAARLAGLRRRAVAAWRAGLTHVRGLLARRPVTQPPAARGLRPVIVPSSLDDLHGPASGTVDLPVRLYWSGPARFDLADPHQVADMCEAVLDVGTIEDIARYLNADLLIRAWPVLGANRAKRDAWEDRFPVLRRQRLAAAA